MTTDAGSVAARRELGAELQRFRKASGLTGQQLASALGWHQSKVSRIEAARNVAHVEDIAALLDVLAVSKAQRASLLALAEESVGGPSAWRNSSREGLTRRQQDFIALEASAAVIAHYQPMLLPGYLQTREYARRVVEMADGGGRRPRGIRSDVTSGHPYSEGCTAIPDRADGVGPEVASGQRTRYGSSACRSSRPVRTLERRPTSRVVRPGTDWLPSTPGDDPRLSRGRQVRSAH